MMMRSEKITETTAGFCDIIDITAKVRACLAESKLHNGLIALFVAGGLAILPGLVRYVQSHIVEERRRPDIPATDVEIDGIAELWYEDAAAMARAMASPEAKALHADGALFIGRIKSFTTVELEVVPPRGR
jgi:uncharacterized protein (TIGR02118 family)